MDRFVSRIARWCGALVALFLVGVCVAPEETFRTPTSPPARTQPVGSPSAPQTTADVTGQPSSESERITQHERARVRVSATQNSLRRLPAAHSGSPLSTISNGPLSAGSSPTAGEPAVEPMADSIAPTTGEPSPKATPAEGHEPSLAPLEPEPQPAVYTTGDGRRLAAATDGASLRSILVVPGSSLTLPTTLAPSSPIALPSPTGAIINPSALTPQATRVSSTSSTSSTPQPAPALALTPPQNNTTVPPPTPAAGATSPTTLAPPATFSGSTSDSPSDDNSADDNPAELDQLGDDPVDDRSADEDQADDDHSDEDHADASDGENVDGEEPADGDSQTETTGDDQVMSGFSGNRVVTGPSSNALPAPLMVTNQWVVDESKPKSNPVPPVAPTASPTSLSTPLPAAPPVAGDLPAAGSLPATGGLPVAGDLPVDVQRRVQQELATGFSLAERGAVFSAQARFLQALTWIAQSHDQRDGQGRHTQAMQQGLQALDEIKDLVGLAANSAGGTDLAHVVHYHRTRVVSETELSKLTPQTLADRYSQFARQQLVAATGKSATASKTLFGLAKLQSVLQSPGAQDGNLRDARAQAFYQAALDADPNNFPAANELGVLLSRQGRPEEALAVLRQAARVGGSQPQVWHNLAAVHRQLGQPEQARLAEVEKQKLQASQEAKAGTALPPVTWVSPDQFAANSPPEGQWGRSAAAAANDSSARTASSSPATASPKTARESTPAKGTQSGSSGRSLSQRWNPWRRAPQSESNDATRWR